MQNTTTPLKLVNCNRFQWFEMLILYLKMRAFQMLRELNPMTSWETFELQWPSLLDQLLADATARAIAELGQKVKLNYN